MFHEEVSSLLQGYTLPHLTLTADINASMRRIDLFCKLLAPVFISLVDSFSTGGAIWTLLGLNTASVLVEYLAIAQA
jgi:hypothetical protein